MITAIIVIKIFLSYCTLLAISFLLGKALEKINLKDGNNSMSIFEIFFYGYLILVSLYAIFITKGHSILLPIPLLLVISRFVTPRASALNERNSYRNAIYLLSAGFVVFIFYYGQAFISLDPDIMRLPGGDFSFYARLGEFIQFKGVETYKIDYYNSGLQALPYHFIDIWTIGLISQFSGLHEYYSLVLVTYPLLASIFILGVYQLFKNYFQNSFVVGVVSVFVLLFSGIGWLYPKFIITADIHDYAPAYHGKLNFIACVVVYAILLLLKNEFERLFVIAAAFVLASFTLTPALGVFCGFVILYALLGNKISFKRLLIPAFAGLGVILYFIYFYKNSMEERIVSSVSTSDFIIRGSKMFISGILEYSILIPVLVCVAFLIKVSPPDRRQALIFLLLFPVAGLIGWCLLWPVDNEARQFYHNFFTVSASVITGFALLWLLLYSHRKVLVWTGSIAFLLLITKSLRFDYHVESVNKKDINLTKNFILKNGPGAFANYRDSSEFNSYYTLFTKVYQPLPWICLLLPHYQNYSLNTFDLIKKCENLGDYKEQAMAELKSSSYSQYISKKNGISQDPLGFSKEYNLKYFTLSPLVKQPYRWWRASDSVVLSNGWKLYYIGSHE